MFIIYFRLLIKVLSQNICYGNIVLYLILMRNSQRHDKLFYLSFQALQNFLLYLILHYFSVYILCFYQTGWIPLHWVIFSPARNVSSSFFLSIKTLILQGQSFLIALTFSEESISLNFSTIVLVTYIMLYICFRFLFFVCVFQINVWLFED